MMFRRQCAAFRSARTHQSQQFRRAFCYCMHASLLWNIFGNFWCVVHSTPRSLHVLPIVVHVFTRIGWINEDEKNGRDEIKVWAAYRTRKGLALVLKCLFQTTVALRNAAGNPSSRLRLPILRPSSYILRAVYIVPAMRFFPQARYFNRKLTFSCTLVALSSLNYGFDNQGFATTQAMDQFMAQFGTVNPKTGDYQLEPSWLSLFNSLQYLGFAAGVWIGSIVSARFGRRWCMFSMSVFALCTATIAVTSQHRSQIMAARVLNYVYVGMELSVVPVYQSEIVPAGARAFVVSTYQLALISGGLFINIICRGISTLQGDASFRIPYGLFYVIPSVVLSGIWLVPESPVWLLGKGRREDAKKSLYALRVGAFTDQDIDHQLRQMETLLGASQEHGRFQELFRGVNLKRTLLVLLSNFFQQATGQAFVSQYGAIYVKFLRSISPYSLSVIIACVDLVTTMVAILSADRIGRRPLLLTGTTFHCLSLLIMGALGTIEPVAPSVRSGIVSMMVLTAAFFSLGLATLIYVMSAEIPTSRLRDQTTRLGFVVKVATNFVVSFTVPYLIYPRYAGLNAKVPFIYGGFSFAALLFIWFFVPECSNRTTEEIELMFQKGVAVRRFKDFNVAEIDKENVVMKEDIGNEDGTNQVRRF